ncbi:MAG: DEAD/DEAH box helicase, partial [Gammaproteobacteria bacterium]|nr:DEAD/DEAH box helicase [Gammaproteobacteria bacterium]
DEKGLITLRFFHFYPAQQSQMKIGRFMRCFGEARLVGMRIEMVHPEYEVFDADAIPPLEPSLTPLYPLTEGLTQKRLRGLIQQAFEILNTVELPELLPASIRQLMKFPTLLEALRFVHFPQKGANVDLLLQGKHPMQQRLAFEELLAHRLSLQRLKRVRQAGLSPVLLKKNHYESAFLKSLPFTPTRSQTRVCQEISADLSKPHAMMRLVQGDVGSGKTFVAMLSALQAVENQIQVAVMAPTEILAEQHYLNFDRYFTPLGISVVWLAGKLTSKQREKVRGEVASGQAQVVVGTQALFQEGVEFKSLGYVIIDEQHRFGVEQRKALQDKGKTSGMIPHQLVMTATPIPRT